MIKVRKAKKEDARRMAHVHRMSVKKVCSSSYPKETIDSWASGSTASGVRRAISNPDVNYFVAEEDGVVCGVGATVAERVWLLYLHPDWVGLGIGEKLLRRLETDMKKRGIKNATLESSINACNFYKRQKYIRVKKKTLVFRNGLKVPCIQMKKRLN